MNVAPGEARITPRARGLGILALGMSLAGCLTPTPPSAPATGDAVRLEALSVSPDARLAYNEQVKVEMAYRLETTDSALLLARPYTAGLPTPGGLGHVAEPVSAGRGQATGWFAFATDATVDEIRLVLADPTSHAILASHSIPVDLTWHGDWIHHR